MIDNHEYFLKLQFSDSEYLRMSCSGSLHGEPAPQMSLMHPKT